MTELRLATPFSGAGGAPAETLVLPEGLTVAALLRLAGIPDGVPVRVWIEDWEIEARHWHRVRPRAGRRLVVRLLPAGGGGGGGKSPFRLVASIAIIVAAAVIAPYAAPFIAGATGLSIATATTLAGGLISLTGNLLLNALAPPPRPRLPSLSLPEAAAVRPVYGLSGSTNRLTPWEPVPLMLGRMRVRPPLAAPSYTELVGDDQYLRAVFVVGYGPLDLEQIRIGDTPIETFEGVEVETRAGAAGDAPLTLFPGTVYEEALSIDLRGDPTTVTEGPGTWATRRSRPAATELSVDVTAPQGLGWIGKGDGARKALTVSVEVEHRRVGDATWTAVTTIAMEGSDFRLARAGHRWQVAAGEYDVRLRWTGTEDVGDSAQTSDALVWSALRSIGAGNPVRMPGVALIAIRVKATGQIQGTIQDLSVLATSRVPDWDSATSTWVTRATRNPASLARWILTGAPNKRALATTRIDEPSLRDLHAWCAAEGWTYDRHVTERTTVGALVQEVMAAARARPTLVDLKWGAVIDRPKATPVQLFTPRNSWGFSGSKAYPDPPHAIKLAFQNEETWEADEAVVYRDGFSAANATVFERIDRRGVVNAARLVRLGRYDLATPLLRPERWTLNVDAEHLVATEGDRVLVQHDALVVGVGAARLSAITRGAGSPGPVTGLTLDTAIPLETGRSWGVRVRRATGAQVTAALSVTTSGETRTLTLSPAQPAAWLDDTDLEGGGALVVVGELGTEALDALVLRIEGGRDLSARLTLIPYAPDLFTLDGRPIPAYQPGITRQPEVALPAPAVPAVLSVRSDETVLARGPDGSFLPRLVVTLGRRAGTEVPADRVEMRLRRIGAGAPAGWTYLPAWPGEATELTVADVSEGETVEVQVRAVSADAIASAWGGPAVHTIVGQTSLPPDVPTLSIDGQRRLSWTYPAPPADFAGFQIRHAWGPAGRWDAATPVVDGTVTTTTLDLAGRLPGGTRTILVRAVDRGGRLSAVPATLVVDLGDDAVGNVVVTDDIGAAGYPGTITGGTVAGGALQANGDATLYLPTDGALYLPDAAALYLPSAWLALGWEATVVPPAGTLPATLTLDLAVVGDGWTVEVRTLGDGLYLPTDGGLYLPDGAGLYLGGPDPWRTWPGSIDARPEGVGLRIAVPGGGIRPEITALRAVYDVPDLDEDLQDVAIAAGGTRLPLTQRFRAVSNVLLTLEQDGGGAVSARILDRDAGLGPLVACYDAAGTSVAGTLDARVKGY